MISLYPEVYYWITFGIETHVHFFGLNSDNQNENCTSFFYQFLIHVIKISKINAHLPNIFL